MVLKKKMMETAIVFDGTSAPALVVTSDPKVQRKLQVLAKKDPTIVFKTSDNTSQTWSVPKDLIYFRKRRKLHFTAGSHPFKTGTGIQCSPNRHKPRGSEKIEKQNHIPLERERRFHDPERQQKRCDDN